MCVLPGTMNGRVLSMQEISLLKPTWPDYSSITKQTCGYSIPGGNTAQQEITGALSDFDVIIFDDDPDCIKYSSVKGEAYFECSSCNFRWLSHNVIFKIDLYHRQLLKRYRQRCSKCGSYWAVPCFKSNEFKITVDRVVGHIHSMKKFGEGYSPAFLNEETLPDHDKAYCERCMELDRPCYIIQEGEITQTIVDKSPVSSIFRQFSHVMACYIQKHLVSLSDSLKDFFVQINLHIDDQCGFIHLIPTERSITIANWNKICEEKLELFLNKLDSVSLSIHPEVLAKLPEIIKEVNPKSSPCIKEQTTLQVVGFREEVDKLVEIVQQVKSTQKQKKPCILPY